MDRQITITHLRNPFEPAAGRERLQVDWQAEHSLADYLQEAKVLSTRGDSGRDESGMHLIVCMNGCVIKEDLLGNVYPAAGDIIVACWQPGSFIVGAAMGAVSTIVAAANTSVLFAGAGAFLVKAAFTGIVGLALGAVIQALTPKPKYDKPRNTDFDDGATYGWEPGSNAATEGGALPVLYGTHRVVAPVIAQHIEIDQFGNEILKILLAICEGGAGGDDAVALSDYVLDATYKAIFINENHYANYLTPALEEAEQSTDLLADGTASATNYLSSTYAPEKACDDVNGTAWIRDGSQTGWWKYDYGTGSQKKITGYSVYTKDIGFVVSPKNWTFEGSNDDSNWDVLDTQTNQDTWNTRVEYAFSNEIWYRYYRINVTASKTGVGNLSIAEIEMFGVGNLYNEIDYEFKAGTNDQTSCTEFGDTYSTTSVGKVMDTDWFVFPTSFGGAAEIISLGLLWPNGLYSINETTGDIENESVEIAAEYRNISTDPVGSWTAFSWSPLTVTGNTQSAYRVQEGITGLTPARYEVRVKFNAAPTSGSMHVNKTFWDHLREGVTDDFTYPNTALLAMSILATDSLNNTFPRIAIEATRPSLIIDSTTVSATNPAWICYDLLTNARYGAGIPESRMLLSEFEDWADACDASGIECNIYFDTSISLGDAMAYVSTLGRASIVQRGTKFGVVADKSDTPVQLFTVGNIARGSFTEEFLAEHDLVNSVEVTFFDADRNWSRQVVEVRDADFDLTATQPKVSQVTLYGCTDRIMAQSHGEYLLNCNRYQRRTIAFEADVDAIACQVGDVIQVQHDVTNWGYGGRLVDAVVDGGNTVITLDRSVVMEAGGAYSIVIRLSADDSIITKAVVLDVGTVDEVTVAEVLSPLPAEFDVYAFGATTIVTKKFRVIRISRAGDMRRRITAIEYAAEVYS